MWQYINFNVFQRNYECGKIQSKLRIAGDKKAASRQFPFHVAIFGGDDQRYICGGSLISSKAVVTAAHCVAHNTGELKNKDHIKVLFGSVDLKTLTGKEALREVEQIIRHPNYNTSLFLENDVALIITKGYLKFSETISPICFSDIGISSKEVAHDPFLVLGFGSDNVYNKPSRYLKYGEMSIMNRRHCIGQINKFAILNLNSAFCGQAIERQSACYGDSGGELKLKSENALLSRSVLTFQ